MSIAVLRFPGTNNENDVLRALAQIDGSKPYLVPSGEGVSGLKDASAVVIPGGFSYGDYLRAGAVASVEPIVEAVREISEDGYPVLGICNGFQILTEMGMLPGVLLPNQSARFVCKWIFLRVPNRSTIFTEGIEGTVLRVPIAHAEGNYHCSESELANLHNKGKIPFRYCNEIGEITNESNPNGSIHNIAGIINQRGNVLGLMPHPERACRPALGSTDGLRIIENFVRAVKC